MPPISDYAITGGMVPHATSETVTTDTSYWITTHYVRSGSKNNWTGKNTSQLIYCANLTGDTGYEFYSDGTIYQGDTELVTSYAFKCCECMTAAEAGGMCAYNTTSDNTTSDTTACNSDEQTDAQYWAADAAANTATTTTTPPVLGEEEEEEPPPPSDSNTATTTTTAPPTFDALDTNGDGVLNRAEWAASASTISCTRPAAQSFRDSWTSIPCTSAAMGEDGNQALLYLKGATFSNGVESCSGSATGSSMYNSVFTENTENLQTIITAKFVKTCELVLGDLLQVRQQSIAVCMNNTDTGNVPYCATASNRMSCVYAPTNVTNDTALADYDCSSGSEVSDYQTWLNMLGGTIPK